jgi:voltage-gated potassium channel
MLQGWRAGIPGASSSGTREPSEAVVPEGDTHSDRSRGVGGRCAHLRPHDEDADATRARQEWSTVAETRLERWERASTPTLLVCAAAFLVAYSWVILEPDMFRWLQELLLGVMGLTWATTIVDLVVRVALTPRGSRVSYLGHNKLVVLAAIVPILRPFSLLRHLRKLPGFRGNGGSSLRGRLLFTVVAYELMFVYVISLGVLAVERAAPDGNIKTFGDSIWWACVTVATVGYGDFHPVTSIGRVLAVALMAGGVVIIGTASATIVSSLNERVAEAAHKAKEEHPDHSGD